MDSRAFRSRGVCAAVTAALLAVAVAGHAQQWRPDKNVDIVVGAAAGGGNDTTARTMQKILQDQNLVLVPLNVVNKPGGGGAIALTYMNQVAAKSNVIAVSSNTFLTNHITNKSTIGLGDVTPLAILINEYMAFSVNASSPIKTAQQLVGQLKKDPSAIVLGISTALGNINHVSFALVAQAAGVDPKKVRTVVFNSSGASVTALMGGHVHLIVGPTSIASKYLESGQLRTLAVTSAQRRPSTLATVPTWKELGLDVVVDNWRGVLGPKAMPPQQVAYWDNAFGRFFNAPEWKSDVEANQWDNAALLSKESSRYLQAQYNDLKRALIELELIR
jgi:putative tricarboxylic transport membrane protein